MANAGELVQEWVPLAGEFAADQDKLVFRGKTVEYDLQNEKKSGSSIGSAITGKRFSGGSISATIRFDSITNETACDIMLFYDPKTRFFVNAGLGGGPGMFSIRHWDGTKWTWHESGGDKANFHPNHDYRISARVRGSRITLSVDDVDVLAADVPLFLPSSQVGVWCMSSDRITVSDYRVQTQKPRAFIVMQFTPPYNELYDHVIKPVCEEPGIGLETLRADEEYGPGIIIADVARQILESKLVIAEISPANPNVYYEVGFAHALGKPTILIAEGPTKLPFDVSPFRVLFYENTINGKKRVEDGLRKHLQAILASEQRGLSTAV